MNRSQRSYGASRKSGLTPSLNRSNHRQHSRKRQNWLIRIGECLDAGRQHQHQQSKGQHHQSRG